MATQVTNRRQLRDSALSFIAALAAAGGTTAPGATTSINIGVGPYKIEEIDVEIAFPAAAANTSTSDTYTVQLYDSADNSTFAAVSPVVELVVPGVASTGSLALVKTIKLPVNTRQYIGFNITATSGTGSNVAQSITASLLV
jgi:hypothetical protein